VWVTWMGESGRNRAQDPENATFRPGAPSASVAPRALAKRALLRTDGRGAGGWPREPFSQRLWEKSGVFYPHDFLKTRKKKCACGLLRHCVSVSHMKTKGPVALLLLLTVGSLGLTPSAPSAGSPVPPYCCLEGHEGTTGLGFCGFVCSVQIPCPLANQIGQHDGAPGVCDNAQPKGCIDNAFTHPVLVQKYKCVQSDCGDGKIDCRWVGTGQYGGSLPVNDCWDGTNGAVLCTIGPQ